MIAGVVAVSGAVLAVRGFDRADAIGAELSLGNAAFSDFADDCPRPARASNTKRITGQRKKRRAARSPVTKRITGQRKKRRAARSPVTKRGARHRPGRHNRARQRPRRPKPGNSTALVPDPALIEQGKVLFEDEVVFGQRPSRDPEHLQQQISCADCHLGPAFTDGKDHLVPTRDRKLVLRQTQPLLDIARAPRRTSAESSTGGFTWDGRYPCAEAATQAAILNPSEMNSARKATSLELMALVAFMSSLSAPEARPGQDFDPDLARKGGQLFSRERPATDAAGEFNKATRLSCATCHSGVSRTDNKFHRNRIPTGDPIFDPGRIDPDGNDPGPTLPAITFGPVTKAPLGFSKGQIVGFRTPALIGLRFTAPYFHEQLTGCGTTPSKPRQGLRCVVEHYNQRFRFGFTEAEKRALVEFLMSL